jgi:hypothetical protein
LKIFDWKIMAKYYEQKGWRKPYKRSNVLKSVEEVRFVSIELEAAINNLRKVSDALVMGVYEGKKLGKIKRSKLLSSTHSLTKDILSLSYIVTDSYQYLLWKSKHPEADIDAHPPRSRVAGGLKNPAWLKDPKPFKL